MKRYAIRYVEKRFNIDRMYNVKMKGHIHDAYFRTQKERIAFIHKNKMFAYQYGKVIDGDIHSVVWSRYFIIRAGSITRLAPLQFGSRLYMIEVNPTGAYICMETFESEDGWNPKDSIKNLDEVMQGEPVASVGDLHLFVAERHKQIITEVVEVMCEV